jgi:hypothetical protein
VSDKEARRTRWLIRPQKTRAIARRAQMLGETISVSLRMTTSSGRIYRSAEALRHPKATRSWWRVFINLAVSLEELCLNRMAGKVRLI